MIDEGWTPERLDAEKKYAETLDAQRRAESVSEEAYEKATAAHMDAMRALIVAEARWPTRMERALHNEAARLYGEPENSFSA